MLAHRFNRREQISGHIRLHYVASRSGTDRLAHHLGRIMLRYDQNFSFRNIFPDSPASFQPIHSRHTDVKNDDIRLQAIGLVHGFNSVLCFINDRPLGATAK